MGLLISTLVSTQAKAIIGALTVFAALTIGGWIVEWIYRFLVSPLLLSGVETTLLQFGWAIGWALMFFKAAEWRVTNGRKPVF